MKITDILRSEKPGLSFEVFPPKTSALFDEVWEATKQIARLHPSYMSVTYGAGGSTAQYTAEIASGLKEEGVTPPCTPDLCQCDKGTDPGAAARSARTRNREYPCAARRYSRRL